MNVLNCKHEFQLDGACYVNSAYMGPVPRRAVSAGHKAIASEYAPYKITSDQFFSHVASSLPRQKSGNLASKLGGQRKIRWSIPSEPDRPFRPTAKNRSPSSGTSGNVRPEQPLTLGRL